MYCTYIQRCTVFLTTFNWCTVFLTTFNHTTKAEPRLELNADNYAFYGGQCRADSSVMSIAMMLHKRADSTIIARKVLNGVKASASSSSNEPEWKVLSRGVAEKYSSFS